MDRLEQLHAGMPVPYGGDKVAYVGRELAEAFRPGDRLVVVQDTGDLLHVPADVAVRAERAVGRAVEAFAAMGLMDRSRIDRFFEEFADRLADDGAFEAIASANASDVERARDRGRSTTRLVLSDRMRRDMIDGLRGWGKSEDLRGKAVERHHSDGWDLELVRAGLGVVGFVFEGRPNVFADATGVLRSGNTVVFRIGSDALGTARAIVSSALDPAIEAAGLPPGAVSLVDSPARSAGWAMFADHRLAVAVARGSGAAVAQLGAVARQAGTPVSLHGTGGAWIVVSGTADGDTVEAAVHRSLDRKVCNTLNTCAIVRSESHRLVPRFLAGLGRAASDRNVDPKLHVVGDAIELIPDDWRAEGDIGRAGGIVREPMTEVIDGNRLGVEWEWEESPEVTLVLVDDVDEAIDAFNAQSPRFAASLIAAESDEHDHFFARIDAPFVGNGFTRWVDGQYALGRPELGLSNWQFGRLFGRSGVLSGDSVFTLRARLHQSDPDVGR